MDYLGAGLAVIASDLPGHRSILERTGAGILIDPSSPGTIAAALRRFLDEFDRVGAMKQAASLLARRYEWSQEAAKLIELYGGLLQSAASPGPGPGCPQRE
jgi:sucrose-phosphate synthase